MIIGRVVGTVVSTHKEPTIEDIKLLLVDKIDPKSMKQKGDHLVAMDAVGAGIGEVVMVVQGSSARMTDITTGRPCDASILAILENIEVGGKLVYDKAEDV